MKKLTITRKNNSTLSKQNSKRNRQNINNIKRKLRTQHAGAHAITTTSVSSGRRLPELPLPAPAPAPAPAHPPKTSIAAAARTESLYPPAAGRKLPGHPPIKINTTFLLDFLLKKHVKSYQSNSMPDNFPNSNSNNNYNQRKDRYTGRNNAHALIRAENNDSNNNMIKQVKQYSLETFIAHTIQINTQKRINKRINNQQLNLGTKQSLESFKLEKAKTTCFQAFINIIDNNKKDIKLKDIDSKLEDIKKLLQIFINHAENYIHVYYVIEYLNSRIITEFDKENIVNVLVYKYPEFLKIYDSGKETGDTTKIFYNFYFKLLTLMIIREYNILIGSIPS